MYHSISVARRRRSRLSAMQLSRSAIRCLSPPELQNSPRTPAHASARPAVVAGRAYRKRCCTFGAIFARNAFAARTPTTHRLTSYGPLLRLSVSFRRRPYGRRHPGPMLWWLDGLETAPRKAIAIFFFRFLPVFSTRSPILKSAPTRLANALRLADSTLAGRRASGASHWRIFRVCLVYTPYCQRSI